METEFEFEELPLILTPDGYNAGLVGGWADILFDANGSWRITRVRVVVEKTEWEGGKAFAHAPKLVVPPFDLDQRIKKTLRDDPKWRAHVQAKVDEERTQLRNQGREYERREA